MRKILVLTMSKQQSNYEVTRLVKEAKREGVEVVRALYKDLEFRVEDKESNIWVKGKEIKEDEIGCVWFRVAGTVSGKYIEARNLLLQMLESRDIFCTNRLSYLGWPRMGKIAQHGVFVKNEIPVVPTRIFYTKESVLQSFKNNSWSWPMIVKHERGFQGKSVKKLDSEQKAVKWLSRMDEKNLGMYMWQKFLPTRWDLRVIVLDGKALGAMKRSANGDEFRSNYSLGGLVDSWDLSKDDAQLAEKVASVCRLDYCGVDIMKDEEGVSYILEVNRQCQFKGFEKSTGINVADSVVRMLMEKMESRVAVE